MYFSTGSVIRRKLMFWRLKNNHVERQESGKRKRFGKVAGKKNATQN
jgi:hypothetical protein